MIDVFYPYFESEATWEELRYSLRSIERYFKFDFRVVIAGDLPQWIDPATILHIPHQRVEGNQENTLYDAITKQLLFNIHPETSLHFVRMYDDIYILDEVTLADIGQFKAMYHYDQLPQRSGTWWTRKGLVNYILRDPYYLPYLCDQNPNHEQAGSPSPFRRDAPSYRFMAAEQDNTEAILYRKQSFLP